MNYSIINVVINTYLKVDNNLKQKLLYKCCSSYVSDSRFQFGYIPLASRSFHSSHARGEVQKDGVEVLLSPQEVSRNKVKFKCKNIHETL